jgi:prepilin-type processing-associated H-X9-DG protein
MSNIRQLNSAFSTYTTYRGEFPYGFNNPPNPPTGGYPGQSQYDRSGWWWLNYLKGLYGKNMNDKTILWCPSKQFKQSKLEDDILCGNYGVNLSICKMAKGTQKQKDYGFVGGTLDAAQITNPSQMLLVVDSGYAIINWWHAADVPPVTLNSTNNIENTAYIPGLSINRQRDLWPEQKVDALYGRHPQLTVNVGFADFHAARTKAEDLLVKKKDSNNYENRSPLWAPDSK